MNFREFVEQNTVGYHNDGPGSGFQPTGGSYLSSDQTGSEATPVFAGRAVHLPSTDLSIPDSIPTKKVTSTIKSIELNRNPIFIHLEDGTRIFLTWDEFKRIAKTPKVGKTVIVTFQRRKDDKSSQPSQIQGFQVI